MIRNRAGGFLLFWPESTRKELARKIAELQKGRARIVKITRHINEKAGAETRDLTAEAWANANKVASITPLLPRQQRVDNPGIASSLVVWRRLDPLEAPVDPTGGFRKISSKVFRTEEMSVYLSDRISLKDVISKNPGCYVAEFTVQTIRQVGCIIARDPNDPAHGLIYDKTKLGDQSISRGQAHRIRDAARLIIP